MENEKINCNQCGDYEYCAFQFDKCTGFIPGENSGGTTMKELTAWEYIQHENEFFKKNGEYYQKKVEINKKENSGQLSEEEAEKLRENLKSDYLGFTSIYADDKYCFLCDALEIAYQAINGEVDQNFKTFLWEHKKFKGQIVEMSSGNIKGKLLGVATALDDYYYVIEESETSKIRFVTGVDGIKTVNGVSYESLRNRDDEGK